MQTNILVALKNILESKNNKLIDFYKGTSSNRVNQMGDALEYYVKDIFCSTLNENDFNEKDIVYSEYLSYIGNAKNPPDFIVKNSIGVEVKKIKGLKFGTIALNSSYPKNFLYSDSKLISQHCINCEDEFGGWIKKDMLYVIGNTCKDEKEIKLLWLLDGECYSADKETYEEVKSCIKKGIMTIPDVSFEEKTNELGKVKKIDPLAITDLRIRGMWNIVHPMKVFDYLTKDYDKKSNAFQVYCLILKNKYDALNDFDKKNLDIYIESGLLIKKYVKIKNPNNPAKYIDAVLFDAKLT